MCTTPMTTAFPNGIPNPLLPENPAATAEAVVREGWAFLVNEHWFVRHENQQNLATRHSTCAGISAGFCAFGLGSRWDGIHNVWTEAHA